MKKAIKEANQSVTVKPRKQSTSEGQLEVAASSAQNNVERRVHLKRGRSNVSDSEPLDEKEEDVESDVENEESVGKKKKTGEPDKHQVIVFYRSFINANFPCSDLRVLASTAVQNFLLNVQVGKCFCPFSD